MPKFNAEIKGYCAYHPFIGNNGRIWLSDSTYIFC